MFPTEIIKQIGSFLCAWGADADEEGAEGLMVYILSILGGKGSGHIVIRSITIDTQCPGWSLAYPKLTMENELIFYERPVPIDEIPPYEMFGTIHLLGTPLPPIRPAGRHSSLKRIRDMDVYSGPLLPNPVAGITLTIFMSEGIPKSRILIMMKGPRPGSWTELLEGSDPWPLPYSLAIINSLVMEPIPLRVVGEDVEETLVITGSWVSSMSLEDCHAVTVRPGLVVRNTTSPYFSNTTLVNGVPLASGASCISREEESTRALPPFALVVA